MARTVSTNRKVKGEKIMTKQTTTLTIPTELLVRIIDNEVDARKDAWEISWKLCRIFPGLNDASSVAEFLLKKAYG